MALILSLETATSVCSAALHEDGILLAFSEYHVPQSTASKLSVLIDQLFELATIHPSQVSALAVSAGPGSYTGLRIGVATAKGFCYALNIPLIAINTLELLTYQISSALIPSTLEGGSGEAKALLCPMLDARRMEVYTLLAGTDLKVIEPTEAKVIDELSYQLWLEKNKILFFGNGSDKCREMIQHENAVFLPGVIPSAAKLGEMAFRKFNSNQFEDLAAYEPYYLKDFMVKKPKSAA
jgi:tRNA threonylcarbamoyladenosine biosynthesis protein TsaB